MPETAFGTQFWLSVWERGGGAFTEAERGHLLDAHWGKLGVPAGSSVLVPLSGKSPDMAWLAARGFDVTGVEISAIACTAFFAERGLEPICDTTGRFTRWNGGGVTILQGDFLDLEGTYDAALDRGALVAMPESERPRYARHLLQRLKPGSAVLCATIEYAAERRSGPPFPVFSDEVRELFPNATECARHPLRRSRWDAIGGAEAVVWLIRKATAPE